MTETESFVTYQRCVEFLNDWLSKARHQWKPCTFSIKDGRDRSVEQNKLLMLWARLMVDYTGESAEEAKARWKADYLIDELRAEDEFVDLCASRTYDYFPEYEDRLKSADLICNSHRLTVTQFHGWLNRIQAGEAHRGFTLPDPEDKST